MYSRALLAYDGTGCAELALAETLRLAADGVHVIVLAVADCPPLPARVMLGQDSDAGQAGFAAVEKGRVLLEQVERQFAARGLTVETMLVDLTEVGDQSVARIILEEAASSACDLIVMGTHGRQGFKRFLLGSVAEQVVRESSCPVLLVRGDTPAVIRCASPSEIYGQWPEANRAER